MHWLLLLLALLTFGTSAEAAKIRIIVESPGGLQQKVYLSRPVDLAADRPVVFVVHGSAQSAREVLDQWQDLAIEHQFLLVAPEFEGRQFPGSTDYSLGNLFDDEHRLRPAKDRYFAMIEPIFDEVRRRYGMTSRRYSIYGASAGAQFVQRFLYFVPEARVFRAVAADADWYTMPVLDIRYPFGLFGTPVGDDQLARALQSPLTILLSGQEDNSMAGAPGVTAEVLAQGPDRLARGGAFFETAQIAAAQAGVPLGWRSVALPAGTDTSGPGMAEAATPYLLSP